MVTLTSGFAVSHALITPIHLQCAERLARYFWRKVQRWIGRQVDCKYQDDGYDMRTCNIRYLHFINDTRLLSRDSWHFPSDRFFLFLDSFPHTLFTAACDDRCPRHMLHVLGLLHVQSCPCHFNHIFASHHRHRHLYLHQSPHTPHKHQRGTSSSLHIHIPQLLDPPPPSQ